MTRAVVDIGLVEIMRALRGVVGVVTADGDCDCRGMVGVVEHVLLGDAERGGRGEGFAAAEVSCVARMGPARNLEPDAVACLEAVGSRPELDPDPTGPVLLLLARVGSEADTA